jgi:hypothetical protein
MTTSCKKNLAARAGRNKGLRQYHRLFIYLFIYLLISSIFQPKEKSEFEEIPSFFKIQLIFMMY